MRFIGTALLICVAARLAAAETRESTAPASDEQRLIDKWIVRSVKLDGKPTAAQIGQKVGDVINIRKKAHQFVLR